MGTYCPLPSNRRSGQPQDLRYDVNVMLGGYRRATMTLSSLLPEKTLPFALIAAVRSLRFRQKQPPHLCAVSFRGADLGRLANRRSPAGLGESGNITARTNRRKKIPLFTSLR
jgi:hypothetical protein